MRPGINWGSTRGQVTSRSRFSSSKPGLCETETKQHRTQSNGRMAARPKNPLLDEFWRAAEKFAHAAAELHKRQSATTASERAELQQALTAAREAMHAARKKIDDLEQQTQSAAIRTAH
jgi:hypothetical protein